MLLAIHVKAESLMVLKGRQGILVKPGPPRAENSSGTPLELYPGSQRTKRDLLGNPMDAFGTHFGDPEIVMGFSIFIYIR